MVRCGKRRDFINFHRVLCRRSSVSTSVSCASALKNAYAIYGLAKSRSVLPGDTVNMEVYAKYLDPDPNNWSAGLTDFMTAVAGGTALPGRW